jgi:vacuolar protein sorting-associated protein 13A/C
MGRGSGSDESNRKNRELTEDDWKQVNEIIGYEQGKSSPMLPDVDLPNMVHSVVEIEMKHNGTRLLSGDRKVPILELTAEGIGCNVKLYPQTQVFDVKLSSYKISCPEGLLGESAMDEKSLYGTFTLHPWDRDVNWMLKAKAAPCYVTVLMPSINRVTQFFSSKEAVSQRVALQTAAALQV